MSTEAAARRQLLTGASCSKAAGALNSHARAEAETPPAGHDGAQTDVNFYSFSSLISIFHKLNFHYLLSVGYRFKYYRTHYDWL